MDDLRTIFDGWKNWIFQADLSDQQREVGRRRLESCQNCIYAKKRMVRKILDKIFNPLTGKVRKTRGPREFAGFKCSICECPLDQKVLSWESECPLPKYLDVRYPHPKRWGRVRFDAGGKLVTEDERVYITEPN